MLKLFKAKSLKNNTKRGRGAGVPAGNKSCKKEKSQGRSMVEMLGVLAIIGVLSIGGIQGYTMAMRKYRANELIDLVNKYAMVVYQSCQNQIMNATGDVQVEWGYVAGPYERNNAGLYDADFVQNAWFCRKVLFEDAGVGSLPQGVVQIGSIYKDYQEDLSKFVMAHADFSIISRSSGDIINVPIIFKDKALCETVMAITGGSGADKINENYNSPDACEEDWEGYSYYSIVVMNN